MNNTKEKIIEKAIELYNIHGVEYVGVRELAKEMGLKGGNITYYFPTKDDLVAEIAEVLTSSNTEIFASYNDSSIIGFLNLHEQVFNNQYSYRSLFVSLPLLLKQNKSFEEKYRARQKSRRSNLSLLIKELFDNNYFKAKEEAELSFIVDMVTFINRFWLSEAIIDNANNKKKKVIDSQMSRLISFLLLVVSKKGQKEIRKYQKSES